MKKILLFLMFGLFLTTAAVAKDSSVSGKAIVTTEKKALPVSVLNINTKPNTDCGFPVYYQDDYTVGYGYLDCNGYTGSNTDFWNWFLSIFF